MGWSNELNDLFWEKNIPTLLDNSKFKEDAKPVIRNFREHNFKTVVLSSRYNEFDFLALESTIYSLKREGIILDDVVVGCKDKSKYCKENNAFAFIDDSPVNCKAVAENTDTHVFTLPTRFYVEQAAVRMVPTLTAFYSAVRDLK